MFTRAEYLRAMRCAEAGIPYSLILVDVATGRFYEASGFAAQIAELQIGHAIHIVIRIAPENPNRATSR
jgi:hypothetical protein